MPDPTDDPYIDPASGVLRNKLGITGRAALDAAEADISQTRALQLLDTPIDVRPDMDGLRRLHRILFSDVYDWAGEIRSVDIRKNVTGSTSFMPASRIISGAGYAFAELEDEKGLRGLPREQFVERLAHHYDQVNYLHPFREGNGRTQRLFWSGIARAAGWNIDWDAVSGPANDDASKRAMESASPEPLVRMLEPIVTPSRPPSARAPTAKRGPEPSGPLRFRAASSPSAEYRLDP